MIDMSNNFRIINVQDPINPQDAMTLNKAVQLITAAQLGAAQNNTLVQNYTLTGTNRVKILSVNSGAYTIKIESLVTNGPFAIFHVAKTQNLNGTVNRYVSAGSNQLEMEWIQSQGIKLWKTNTMYDGNYKVTIS